MIGGLTIACRCRSHTSQTSRIGQVDYTVMVPDPPGLIAVGLPFPRHHPRNGRWLTRSSTNSYGIRAVLVALLQYRIAPGPPRPPATPLRKVYRDFSRLRNRRQAIFGQNRGNSSVSGDFRPEQIVYSVGSSKKDGLRGPKRDFRRSSGAQSDDGSLHRSERCAPSHPAGTPRKIRPRRTCHRPNSRRPLPRNGIMPYERKGRFGS